MVYLVQAKDTGNVQDKLKDRVLRARHLQPADLESTTLGKHVRSPTQMQWPMPKGLPWLPKIRMPWEPLRPPPLLPPPPPSFRSEQLREKDTSQFEAGWARSAVEWAAAAVASTRRLRRAGGAAEWTADVVQARATAEALLPWSKARLAKGLDWAKSEVVAAAFTEAATAWQAAAESMLAAATATRWTSTARGRKTAAELMTTEAAAILATAAAASATARAAVAAESSGVAAAWTAAASAWEAAATELVEEEATTLTTEGVAAAALMFPVALKVA